MVIPSDHAISIDVLNYSGGSDDEVKDVNVGKFAFNTHSENIPARKKTISTWDDGMLNAVKMK